MPIEIAVSSFLTLLYLMYTKWKGAFLFSRTCVLAYVAYVCVASVWHMCVCLGYVAYVWRMCGRYGRTCGLCVVYVWLICGLCVSVQQLSFHNKE